VHPSPVETESFDNLGFTASKSRRHKGARTFDAASAEARKDLDEIGGMAKPLAVGARHHAKDRGGLYDQFALHVISVAAGNCLDDSRHPFWMKKPNSLVTPGAGKRRDDAARHRLDRREGVS